jgi:hypothetical protein
MNILAAIKREERRVEKQLGKLNHQLNGVRAAAKALGGSAEREVAGVKKRVLSAAGRAAIAMAAKKRWAKVRKQEASEEGRQLELVDCRKVTITSCYASKLVWRQTAKCPSPATNVRNSAASLNRVLYRPATSFAPSSS